MQGFFSKKETESVSAVGGKIHSCAACGLYKHCQTPKMKPRGKFEKEIMIIGEAPDEISDSKGKPFRGSSGRLLQATLATLGIDLERDCMMLYAVNCRPEDDRDPTGVEVDHCRSVKVWKAVKHYQPKVIITLGKYGLQSIIGHRWKGSLDVRTIRGYAIPDQEVKAWVCPTYDPHYLIRKDKPKDLMKIWKEDLQQAIEHADIKFRKHRKPEIEIVSDLSFLNDAPKRLSAFDWETTGIKPQAFGHRILTGAIADSEDHVKAFIIPKTKEGRLPLRNWLRDPSIPKIAHNMKYEDTWSKVIMKVTVGGWEWDTMLAAHILDNRSGTKSLKLQTYLHFGVMGYDDEVLPYMRSNRKLDGDNGKNKLKSLLKTKRGRKALLEYNALDAIFEYRLALLQMDKLDYDFLPF